MKDSDSIAKVTLTRKQIHSLYEAMTSFKNIKAFTVGVDEEHLVIMFEDTIAGTKLSYKNAEIFHKLDGSNKLRVDSEEW